MSIPPQPALKLGAVTDRRFVRFVSFFINNEPPDITPRLVVLYDFGVVALIIVLKVLSIWSAIDPAIELADQASNDRAAILVNLIFFIAITDPAVQVIVYKILWRCLEHFQGTGNHQLHYR